MRIITIHQLLLWILTILASIPLHGQQSACNATVLTLAPKRKTEPPVADLVPDNLRVKIGGKTTRIGSITGHPMPLRVSIILDVGAKQTPPSWATTLRILDDVLAALPAETEFSLITFDGAINRTIVAHKDGQSMKDALHALSPSRTKETKESMLDALTAGATAFEHPQPGDVELTLTASEENLGAKSQADIERQLSASHIRLFGVSFDLSKLPAHPTTASFVSASESFSSAEAISRSSGGVWARTQAGSATAGTGIGNIVARLIMDFFVLELQPEHPLERAEELKIELLNNPRIPPNDAVLFYPQKLYPCQ